MSAFTHARIRTVKKQEDRSPYGAGEIRTTKRANLGVVPVQNRKMPSSVKIRYAQWNEFLYACRASRLCMRVLITLFVATQPNISGLNSPRTRETNALERHGGVDGDKPRNCAYTERHHARHRLTCPALALHELLEGRIRRKAYRRVGTCSH